MLLYHGTNKRNLEKILREGIKPRGKEKGNWDEAPSRHDLVYLSNCYAPYYASAACKKKGDVGVILKLEIDPKKVKLYPDEEFIFNCSELKSLAAKHGNAPEVMSSINPREFEIIRHLKTKKKTVGWEASLQYLGTVSADFVPVECIVGVYEEQTKIEFIMNCDPSISPMNYLYCGESYKQYLAGLPFKALK